MAAQSQKIRFGSKDLWQIARTGDLNQLENALANGADINAANNFGLTPLMMAAYHGRAEMVKALVERGADVNAVDNGGLTAARLAKDAGHEETVATFVALGIDTAAPRNKAPRQVGVIHDDRLDEIEDDGLHSAQPDKEVRTLSDPPEIWELVQAEPQKVNRTATLANHFKLPRLSLRATHFNLLRPILLAAFVLLVIGGVVAWFMTRPKQTEAGVVATPVKPASAGRIAVTGRAAGGYESFTSEESQNQVETKSKRSRPGNFVTTSSVSRAYTPRRPSDVRPLTDTNLRRNETAERREPENSSATAPPASTSPPKPKVIQWP